jgi:hypothetical protein
MVYRSSAHSRDGKEVQFPKLLQGMARAGVGQRRRKNAAFFLLPAHQFHQGSYQRLTQFLVKWLTAGLQWYRYFQVFKEKFR